MAGDESRDWTIVWCLRPSTFNSRLAAERHPTASTYLLGRAAEPGSTSSDQAGHPHAKGRLQVCARGEMLAIIPVSPAAPASASSTLSAACFCASVITMPAMPAEEWMGREPSSLQTNKSFGS